MKINKKGSAPGFILIGMFLIIFLVNCYFIMIRYDIIRNKRYVITSDIENSYRQSLTIYQNNFEQFCETRDFINDKYKPSDVYIISPAGTSFNVDYIVESSKTYLNTEPLDTKEVLNMLDGKVDNDKEKQKIQRYLNSSPKNILVFYKYKDNSLYIEKSFTIEK